MKITQLTFNELEKHNWILGFHNVPKTGGTAIGFHLNKLLGTQSINIGPHSSATRFKLKQKQLPDFNQTELILTMRKNALSNLL